MAKVVNGQNIKNMPWEECPNNYTLPIWRFSKNPITKVNQFPHINRIFNSSLVPFGNEFIGVFRCDGNDGSVRIHVGHSKDGINIEIEKEPIHFLDLNGNKLPDTLWGYDPRIIKIDDWYFINWCDEIGNAPTIGIAKTKDFKTFYKILNPFIPNNRNGVLFPRKINGKYYILSRPSDASHTPFGDIYISESKDLEYWGNHRVLLKKSFAFWCGLKIGGGPAPIETDEGWLVFIHGVNATCNGYVYSAGAMILDKDDPTKILHLCREFLLAPEKDYEQVGFVSNVVFPTSILVDQETSRMAIYYGCADTYTSLAFTTVDRVINHIKENDILNK